MAHRFRTLETEMLADPLVRDYASMTDIGVADDINTNSRTAPDRNSISVAEMWDATIQSEYESRPPNQKTSYDQMLTVASGGALDVTPGSKAHITNVISMRLPAMELGVHETHHPVLFGV